MLKIDNSLKTLNSEENRMRIAVVALGKIGLPLAVQFASKGHEVIGVDVNPHTVDLVNEGKEPFPGEAHLAEKLAELVPAGRLRATTDYAEAIPGVDAVVVVVPLFVNDETWQPDFGWMDEATKSLAAHLTPGTIVSYETTLPVGTLRGRFKPMIEQISGLEEGRDFTLIFSPERVLTGRVFADLRRYPKLVGGLSEDGTRRGIALYQQLLDFDVREDLPQPNGVWDMGSAEAAEMAKLAETTYRDVVGGHCIPVYPRLYLSTDPDASVVRTARSFNATMPQYVVDRAKEILGDLTGLRVVVLGASYRGKVKETAFSGVFPTVDALRAAGAQVLVQDPMYTDEELEGFGWQPYHLGENVDVAIVQADHPEYSKLTPADLPGVRLLLDGRRITDPALFTGVPRITIGGGE